jgi:pimeloyl-ACP methyl ester carboxylesterase
MRLVLIHGRAQAGKDPAALQKEWRDALDYGAARANRVVPPGTELRFPFYGDELARLIAELAAPLGAEVNAKGPNPDGVPDLRGEIIAEMAAALGITETDIRLELHGAPVQKGPENWEWIQATLRALDRIPGFNSRVIDLVTRDVYVYLENPAVRKAVDDIVLHALEGEESVVVAHSLGTVVAYNALSKRPGAPVVRRLVTLGSPLGIKGIKRMLASPLRCPPCVQSWFNAYDDRDVVALAALDARNFDIAPPIENKSDVRNFTENRHGIAGYLADPIVASKIVERLS